nr:MAG TPA: hypothetical protein [Inoviridae sp.]
MGRQSPILAAPARRSVSHALNFYRAKARAEAHGGCGFSHYPLKALGGNFLAAVLKSAQDARPSLDLSVASFFRETARAAAQGRRTPKVLGRRFL